MNPTIAVSLLTYNDLLYVRPCLDSLFHSDLSEYRYKLFVLDNGSKEPLRRYLLDLPVDKQILFNAENQGIVVPRIDIYREIKEEGFDFLLEIHADMLFPSTWLTPLLGIDNDRTIILEPHIYVPKRRIDLRTAEKRLESLRIDRRYDRCRQVHPWMIKIRLLDTIGGYYDPNYAPQCCEDDDLVYRALSRNLLIRSTGESWVVHYGAVTRRKALVSYTREHREYFERKHQILFESFLSLFECHPFRYEGARS